MSEQQLVLVGLILPGLDVGLSCASNAVNPMWLTQWLDHELGTFRALSVICK